MYNIITMWYHAGDNTPMMQILPGAPHVADYILATAKLDMNIELDQLQINKLCYLVNGFTLQARDEPAFHNDVEAWKYGPVVPAVYEAYRMYGDKPITALDLCRTSLTDTESSFQRWKELVAIIGKEVASIAFGVVREYGECTGGELVNMTHKRRTPWKKAYRPGHNNVIPTDAIRQFYRTLKPNDKRR